MECYVLPIRELSSKERRKNISNKYKKIRRIVVKRGCREIPIFAPLMGEKERSLTNSGFFKTGKTFAFPIVLLLLKFFWK